MIIGSSLAALRARKIDKRFGQAGVAGGIAVLAVGIVEAAANWTLAGSAGLRVVVRLHGLGASSRRRTCCAAEREPAVIYGA